MGLSPASASPSAPPRHRPSRNERGLTAGAVAGPAFVVLSFAQVPLHPGLDLTRHAFSFLLLGPFGWLQTVTFVLAGLAFVASGPGLRRVVAGRAGRWAAGLVTTVGVGLVLGGLFPPDPSLGYPAGAPSGVPEHLSAASTIHAVAFFSAMAAWCALLAVLAGRVHRSGRRGWAAGVAATSVGLLAVPAVSTQSYGTVLLYGVATIAFLTTSALFVHLGRLDGPDSFDDKDL